MQFNPTFYRVAGVASIVSAVTTLMLIFLPKFFPAVDGFDARMQLVDDPAYVLRSWAYLIHPFLAMTAALGVAMRIRRDASAAAVVGLLGFLLWGCTEAAQQTMTLFAFDKWRVAYAAADELMRAQIRVNAAMYDGLWDAMYFLLLLGFTVGNTSFGVALARRGQGLTRIIGFFFFGAVAVTIPNILREIHWPTLSGPLEFWSYPAIQPLGRTLIGVWLWRFADESKPWSRPA